MIKRIILFPCQCLWYFNHEKHFHQIKCRQICLISLIFFCILTWVILKQFSFFCTQMDIRRASEKLCHLYEKEIIDGNMCDDFCSHHVEIGECEPYHLGKEVVFKAYWKGQHIVIKSRYLNLEDYEGLSLNEDSILQNITLDEFGTILRNKLKFGFNITWNKSFNKQLDLWFLKSRSDISNSARKFTSMINSIWSLLQQDEYVLFKLFEDKHIFPKVIGSCGHFYAVKYELPLRILKTKSNFFRNFSIESNQDFISFKFLDLIRILENSFHETLYLCDVKLDHFGIGEDLHLKILDADTAFFHSSLNNMLSRTECVKDADCTFWDCKAVCHPHRKKCSNMINNNLQIICQKIIQKGDSFLLAILHQLYLLFFPNYVGKVITNSCDHLITI